MAKKKCTLSIEQDLWDLAKINNANVSEMVSDIIELRFGHLHKFLNIGLGYCFHKDCGKKIGLHELNISVIRLIGNEILRVYPKQKLTIEEKNILLKRTMFFFYAMCDECLEKISTISKDIEQTLMKPADLFVLLRNMRKVPNIDDYYTIPAKGQVWISNAYEFTAITEGISVSELENELLEAREG